MIAGVGGGIVRVDRVFRKRVLGPYPGLSSSLNLETGMLAGTQLWKRGEGKEVHNGRND
jgi:hypothetical protein